MPNTSMSSAGAPTFRGLPVGARLYIPGVVVLAAGALAIELAVGRGPQLDPTLLIVAAALCAAGSLFEVLAPAHFSFQPNLIIFLGASLLVPPWSVGVLAVVCFLPGWLVHRFRWYMVIFKIASYTLAGLAAHEIVRQAGFLGADWSPDAGSAAALAAASVAFVVINHTLSVVVVVTLARGRSLRNSVEDMLGWIPMDLALALTGACLAALWASAPTLALLAVGPMVLVYRALWVPVLEHKSRTDSKTGLHSSEYLTGELENALACAKRDEFGLSLVMIDLDQLRGSTTATATWRETRSSAPSPRWCPRQQPRTTGSPLALGATSCACCCRANRWIRPLRSQRRCVPESVTSD